MSKVKVSAFSVSLDGFGAGPSQSLENPLGIRLAAASAIGFSLLGLFAFLKYNEKDVLRILSKE